MISVLVTDCTDWQLHVRNASSYGVNVAFFDGTGPRHAACSLHGGRCRLLGVSSRASRVPLWGVFSPASGGTSGALSVLTGVLAQDATWSSEAGALVGRSPPRLAERRRMRQGPLGTGLTEKDAHLQGEGRTAGRNGQLFCPPW